MDKAAKFMKRHGMAAETIDVGEYGRIFCEKAELGLAGRQETLPMIPTYLSCEASIPQRTPAAVIDAGGTNFRTALVSFCDGKERVEELEKHDMPGAKAPVSWERFIDATAERVAPLMDRTDRIGFCFSYPIEVTPERDAIVTSLTKQVRIDGACGKRLGRDLAAALEKRGLAGKRIVVLNDTPATLLGGIALRGRSRLGGVIGLVAGTGMNTCCELPAERIKKLVGASGRMLVNLESGSFDCFARGDFDLEMDAQLPDTGRYVAEKMVSGRYLGPLCLATLRGAARERLLSIPAAKALAAVSELETARAGAWCAGEMPECFKPEDRAVVQHITRELFDRAARCTAAQLDGIMRLTGDSGACISVDGSLYKRSELFSGLMRQRLAEAGRSFEIVTGEEMSLLGAAAAALMN